MHTPIHLVAAFSRARALLFVLVLSLCAPGRAAAQTCVEGCTIDESPPVVTINPAQGSYETPSRAVTVLWQDDLELDLSSYRIVFNGQDVTAAFTHTGNASLLESSATLTLAGGTNTLMAEILDKAGKHGTTTATYTYSLPLPAPAAKPARTLDPAQVAPGMVHPGSAIRRDMCLTISVGPGAAYECGDLRLVHALPGMRVLNTPRTAALIYNSQHAQPKPVFPFNLQMAPGSIPSAVRAVLSVSEVGQPAAVRAQKTWTAANWSSGLWRFALSYDAALDPTNVYVYTLQVFTTIGGVESEVHTYTGDFAVVNRANSPFGAGWWVAGLEQRIWLADGARALVVGGDGSTRVYRWVATNTAVAENVDRPDTLRSVYIDAQLHSYRRLPNGSEVWYDPQGRHYKTVTRLGHTTWFRYDGPGRLDLITLPKPAGGTVEAQYVFGYDTGGRLEWVCAIVSGTSCRNTLMQYALGDRRVTGITDPDTYTVTFAYTGTGREVRGRTNRLGTGTTFTYDPGGRLRQAWLMVAGDTLIHTITATESQGLTTAQVTASTFTSYNGPRQPTDVVDISRIWVNRWGAPTRIRDPGLNTTYLTRSDSRFPALVTRVDYPNGRVVSAEYDARGNLKAQTDWSHSRTLADGSPAHATTRYERTNPSWPDFVTQETTPEGEVSFTGYHPNGSVAWQQPGSDASRRVRFDYNSLGLVERVWQPATATLPESSEFLQYDPLRGNLQYSTSPLGARTVFHTDGLGRTWKTESPIDGVNVATTVTTFDGADRPKLVTTSAPMLHGASPGQLQTVSVENHYDKEGNVLRVDRWSTPNAANVGVITTRWNYDAAGRAFREWAPDATPGDSLDNPRDSTVYDLAGNPTVVITRRGDTIRTRFDLMNRPEWRSTSARRYASHNDRGIPTRHTPLTCASGEVNNIHRPYPYYPSNYSDCSLTIPGDTVVFGYDVMGNLRSADNRYAKVRRGYHLNGQLLADTLKVQTLALNDTTKHVYVLGYTYDLNGRRTVMQHPGQLAPVSNAVTRYAYDPLTGELARVTDPLNNAFGFTYDQRGQLGQRSLPAGASQRYGYDDGGRIANEAIAVPTVPYGVPLDSTTMAYDDRGKLLYSRNWRVQNEWTSNLYSGLGHLVEYEQRTTALNQANQSFSHVATGSYRYDALGNTYQTLSSTVLTRHNNTTQTTTTGGTSTYQPGTGRQTRVSPGSGSSTEYFYDLSGNQDFQATGSGTSATDRASYYGGDGKLRFAELRSVTGVSPQHLTFEEYRYDPLGRRVLVHTRKWCEGAAQGECAFSTVRRTVWDGDQTLYEIQMEDSDAWRENDSQRSPLSYNSAAGFDPNPQVGRVLLTHGPGIDQPLSVIRMNYGDTYAGTSHVEWPTFTVIPIWNYRGRAPYVIFSNGGRTLSHPAGQVQLGTVWRLAKEAYGPAANAEVTSNDGMHQVWLGSVMDDQQDASGLLYRRNRYYDPATGRFTQEDPIGLAGGVNVYGFAAGDPVSYSDPYGLCIRIWRPECRNKSSAVTYGDVVHLIYHPSRLLSMGYTRDRAAQMVAARQKRWGTDEVGAAKANAFRHIYGSCDLTRKHGMRAARQMTSSHERTWRRGDTAQEMDSRNDLGNNEIGLQAGNSDENQHFTCENVADREVETGHYYGAGGETGGQNE